MSQIVNDLTALPLALVWDDRHHPLPRREARLPPGARLPSTGLEAPPWYTTGQPGAPFDLGDSVRRLCADIARHCKELAHIDVSRILFAMTQARSSRPHGLQARVTPLRFHRGSLYRKRHGVYYQVQRYQVNGQEMLYLITFCLPRFLDQGFDDKMITLFHELFHISPAFDGDLRRHKGRYALHSHSKRQYDAYMADLARGYLSNGADRSLHHFLRLSFAQLQHRHGSVQAVVVPRPRLVPLPQNHLLPREDIEMAEDDQG